MKTLLIFLLFLLTACGKKLYQQKYIYSNSRFIPKGNPEVFKPAEGMEIIRLYKK